MEQQMEVKTNEDRGVVVTEEEKTRKRRPRKAKMYLLPKSDDTSRPRSVGRALKNKVENYYLSKKVKLLVPSLETVFEEQEGTTYCSKRKFKRLLEFDVVDRSRSLKRLKTKKRIGRAKKLVIANRYLKRKKISMAAFMSKLAALEAKRLRNQQ